MAIFILNTTKSGNGKGTVTSDVGIPPISCGLSCSGQSTSETSGTTITLTAVPAAGSMFVKWSGNASGLPSSSKTFAFTMDTNPININAEFRSKKRGGVGAIGKSEHIYFNDQQMENMIRSNPPSSSNGISIQRSHIGYAMRAITIPQIIGYGGANYSFSGVVDSRNVVQNIQALGYSWKPGLVFYRYTLVPSDLKTKNTGNSLLGVSTK